MTNVYGTGRSAFRFAIVSSTCLSLRKYFSTTSFCVGSVKYCSRYAPLFGSRYSSLSPRLRRTTEHECMHEYRGEQSEYKGEGGRGGRGRADETRPRKHACTKSWQTVENINPHNGQYPTHAPNIYATATCRQIWCCVGMICFMIFPSVSYSPFLMVRGSTYTLIGAFKGKPRYLY